MKLKLVDKQDRSVLSEGRNHQMGFALCKRIDDETVETAHPISPCKDYCSDVVWTEHVDKQVIACGLRYNKKGIFDGKVSFLAIKICDYFQHACRGTGAAYAFVERDSKRMHENRPHMEALLRHVEQQMGVEPPTEICVTDTDALVAKMAYFWCQYPYLTSLYCLLLRSAQYYDGKVPPDEFLKSLRTPGRGDDHYHWAIAGPRLDRLIKLGVANVPKQHMDDTQEGSIFHSQGICGYSALANLAG